MKSLHDLRPCAHCGGPVGLLFYVVRASVAVVNRGTAQQFLGMHHFFGGHAPSALVDNFVPGVETAVTVAGDQEPSLMAELSICPRCYHSEALDLPLLIERVREQSEAAAVVSPAEAVTS